VFTILGLIASVLVLIIAVTISRVYMRKHRKEFVNGASPQTQNRSFFSENYGLIILILTPILFGLAWLIGWMYSR
jgi:hypothetical protein